MLGFVHKVSYLSYFPGCYQTEIGLSKSRKSHPAKVYMYLSPVFMCFWLRSYFNPCNFNLLPYNSSTVTDYYCCETTRMQIYYSWHVIILIVVQFF